METLKKLLIFQEVTFQPQKIKRTTPKKLFLNFRKGKPRQKFLYFLERKLFLYFRKQKPRKNYLYFRKRNFLIPEKVYSELWHNGSSLYFRKVLFRTLAYSESWYIQNPRHIQNTVKHLRWNVLKK